MRLLVLLALVVASFSAFASNDFAEFVLGKLKDENPNLHHQYQMEYLSEPSASLGKRIEEVAGLEVQDPNGTWQEI